MDVQMFRATVAQKGSKGWIEIPFDPNEVWGKRDRHHVCGTANGTGIRGALALQDGRYVLSLGPVWRRDTGTQAGMEIEVELRPEGPQSSALAEDLALALDSEPKARAFFDQLPTFYRKNFMRWIDSAKRPETRANRIREMVALLADGKRER